MPGISKPDCECHGEPMYWNTDARYTAGGYWRCPVRAKAKERDRYANMSGVAYNRMLLRHRRNKALKRIARRGVFSGPLSRQES
jgi:hypothetical protein